MEQMANLNIMHSSLHKIIEKFHLPEIKKELYLLVNEVIKFIRKTRALSQ